MQKRAQIQSQVFVYLMALIVVGATVLFGYDAIQKLAKQGQEAQSEQFRAQLKGDIERISANYGSVQLKSYSVQASEVCFGSAITAAPVTPFQCPDSFQYSTNPSSYPEYGEMMERAIASGSGNVFVMKSPGMDSFFVSGIFLDNCNLRCFKVTNGRLNVKLTGYGDRAGVS